MSHQAQPTLTAFLTALVAAPAKLERLKSYTPYIARVIFDALKARDPNGVIADADNFKSDLHETGGYFLSTNKFIELTDRNGNGYRITVEDIGDHNLKPLTSAERQMIRDALILAEGNDPSARALAERFRERR